MTASTVLSQSQHRLHRLLSLPSNYVVYAFIYVVGHELLNFRPFTAPSKLHSSFNYLKMAFTAPYPVLARHTAPIGAQSLSRPLTAPPRRPRRFPLHCTSSIADTVATTAPAASYGRGLRFPRRLVGLYELRRLGVVPEKLIVPNSRDEVAVSALVGLGAAATLAVPFISPWVQAEGAVASVIAAGLTLWAVDTLALQGALARKASLAIQNRGRVATHEAGHFLVAHLLGVRVRGYALPSGTPDAGVDVDTGTADAFTLAALALAGIAAEVVAFGASEGGAADMEDAARVARKASPDESQRKVIYRWGLMQAVSLLKVHRTALDELAVAMREGRGVDDCAKIIDAHVDAEALVKVEKPDIVAS